MRKELKPYADEAFGIVETAANEIGSRLPGSDGEKKFADYMAGKLEDIGIKPVKEKFPVSPRASIGGIPYAGWVGIFTGLTLLLPFGNEWSVGTHGLACFGCLVAFRNYKNFKFLSCSSRKNNNTTNLLVSLSAVNTKSCMKFNRFVKLNI